jgi:putative N-acetyltransferase (TIGR04045 family)
MIFEAFRPFRSRDVTFKSATEAWEFRDYWKLRRDIFCGEQAVFETDDRDATDDSADAMVAVASVFGMPDQVIGVVRIWEPTPTVFWGGRLGTHPDHRHNGTVGSGLIKLAVSTACRRGCTRFLATIQPKNVKLFERLHWRTVGYTVVQDLPHVLMEADLSAYRTPVKERAPSLAWRTLEAATA